MWEWGVEVRMVEGTCLRVRVTRSDLDITWAAQGYSERSCSVNYR